MEPSKTHDTALPQQALTRPAGGCPSGPRPEDLMLGGHEGANPHAGQRVATNDDYSLNTEPKTLTKLDMLNVFTEKARLYGPKNRPLDIDIQERTHITLNALYPNGVRANVDVQNKNFSKSITRFLCKCEKLYNECKRNQNYFHTKHEKWLATHFCLEVPRGVLQDQNEINEEIEKSLVLEQNDPTIQPVTPQGPEPDPSSVIDSSAITLENFSLDIPSTSKAYENYSDRQKRRARKSLEQLLEDEPPSKLIKVVSKVVSNEKTGEKLDKGSAQEFEFVKECLKTPTRSKKIAKSIKSKQEPQPYTPDEALALIIDRKLSVEDYISMQQDLKDRGFPAYPPYDKVQIAKKMCYPEEDIRVTEREASVSLHSLLLHTFRRIIQFCDETVSEYCKQKQKDTVHCTFEGSWGFDGSTGQSLYKQKFLDGDDDNENCLFATTYIPLYLKTSDGFVLWSNPSPQSFRFCRPLRIQYRKETKDLILKEKTQVENEIKTLTPFYTETGAGQSIIADPKLYLTIIDGKVFNIITNTNSQLRCPCCGATATQFNDLDVVNSKPVNPETLCYGLSPLHAWIRIFEFLLHLGYKNDPAVMKWRVTKTSPEARIVEERKKRIQDEIRAKTSCLVDVVRPNSGTTNDGNTARTVLSDDHRKTFADILGVETWLVDDLHTILVALSSGLIIDAGKFEEFCKKIAIKYVEKYKWFYMSVTLHKILIHGRQIIEASSLPIGMLSEQAGESRNKYWRYDREHHTRKMNRKTTITDLFHRALESSDPYLSSLTLDKRQKQKKPLPIPDKVLSLLKVPTDNVNYNSSEDYVALPTDEILLQSDDEDNII